MFLDVTGSIASRTCQMMITAQDGSVNWVDLRYNSDTHSQDIKPMDIGLYDGISGVALFLAAFAHVSGDSAMLTPVQAVIGTMRQLMKNNSAVHGIGLASGWGGVLYALTRIAGFLQDEAILTDARAAASFITQDAIDSDRTYDIIGGTAGTILGLLALQAVAPSTELLAQATSCGWHLLSRRIATQSGLQSWPCFNGFCIAGASHGAAGIAYALHRLGVATGEGAFLAASREAIAFENTLFSSEARNWPHFQSSYMASWCYGAPGIGLMRLGCQDADGKERNLQDVEIAIATTQTYLGTDIDHLCCGDMGRLELLMEASRRLERPDLLEQAKAFAQGIVTRANQQGYFRVSALLPGDTYNPGLFRGTAGIGYGLLRLTTHGELPSILLFE